jgi:hypothetical protein
MRMLGWKSERRIGHCDLTVAYRRGSKDKK